MMLEYILVAVGCADEETEVVEEDVVQRLQLSLLQVFGAVY